MKQTRQGGIVYIESNQKEGNKEIIGMVLRLR